MSAQIRLQQMIDSGQHYNYRGHRVRIESWTKHSEIVRIEANVDGNPETFEKDGSEQLEYFLNCFKPITAISEIKSPAQQIYDENKDVFIQLRDQLMYDIKKVKESKEYVHQAKQISNSINSLVNLTKLQIQMIHAQNNKS